MHDSIKFLVTLLFSAFQKKLKYFLFFNQILINILHQLLKMSPILHTYSSALCTEIRSRTSISTPSAYHWCVDIPGQVRMQSISCALCGNYQEVSTNELQDAIMDNARHIICEDTQHIHHTRTLMRIQQDALIPDITYDDSQIHESQENIHTDNDEFFENWLTNDFLDLPDLLEDIDFLDLPELQHIDSQIPELQHIDSQNQHISGFFENWITNDFLDLPHLLEDTDLQNETMYEFLENWIENHTEQQTPQTQTHLNQLPRQ